MLVVPTGRLEGGEETVKQRKQTPPLAMIRCLPRTELVISLIELSALSCRR